MAEIRVSATDFRVHLKDLSNHVASSGDTVVMERHGQRMAVMVSWEDYQLLLERKRSNGKEQRPAPAAPPPERPESPAQIRQSSSRPDPTIIDWRGKRGIVLWDRTELPDIDGDLDPPS